MVGRSTPNRNVTGSDIEFSMDVSSIQDPVQAKLDDLIEITRRNSEQLSNLLGDSTKTQRPKKRTSVPQACSVSLFR